MLTLRPNTFALLALLSLPAGATDYTVEYGGGPPPAPISGRLNDDLFLGDVDPTFHRLAGSCDDAPRSEDYLYDTITLTNTGNSEFGVDVDIDTGLCGLYDSILIGHSPSFDPGDPTANCVLYNDDTFENYCSRLSVVISPSQTMVFVVTSFEPAQTWPWTITFIDRIYEDDFECGSVKDFNCSGSL